MNCEHWKVLGGLLLGWQIGNVITWFMKKYSGDKQ